MKAILLVFCIFCFSFADGQAQNEQALNRTELPVASLEEAGFNRDSIETMLGLINETSRKDFRGLVVIKDNHIVIEEYWNTFWRNTILDIRSAGKSITTLLLGVAMNEGLIESLDQNIYSLFQKNKDISINEDYKKITLRDVLDMSSGLDADTDDSRTVGQAGNWIAMDDWKEYLLNVPLTENPGKRWVYADIHALLVGMAIEEASGMSLRDYAKEKLFGPLGIEQLYWYTNASNQTGAAGNLYISTLDFAKLGLLIVNEGKWGGKQLIHPEFIKELISHEKFDLSKRSLGDSYGMLWYKATKTFGNKTMSYLFASGNGGNQLVVFPEENMVIALTASAYGQGYGHGRSFAIMSMVLGAMK